jgi:ferritin-like metal-binding protein YciE
MVLCHKLNHIPQNEKILTQEFGHKYFSNIAEKHLKNCKMKTKSKPAKEVAKKAVKKVSAKPGAKKTDKEKPVEGLKKLFIDELKDIYWAENALVKTFPKVADKTSSEDLAEAIQNHFTETKEHVTRLENVFSILGIKAEAVKCESMAGLIKETDQIISETEDGPVRDAGIISAAQKIEHYEIATYGTLVAFAQILNEPKVASLLEEILEEEKKADQNLTKIAESVVNAEAVNEMEYDEEE